MTLKVGLARGPEFVIIWEDMLFLRYLEMIKHKLPHCLLYTFKWQSSNNFCQDLVVSNKSDT